MREPLVVRGVTLGSGVPKVCVPLMGRDAQALTRNAPAVRDSRPDVVEWRVDHLSDLSPENLARCARIARSCAGNTPLLLTFRTKREGGERDLPPEDYAALLTSLLALGVADLLDVELFTGDAIVADLVRRAHTAGVAVIGSSHDFSATPEESELTARLERMAALGCDVAKVAVMPQNSRDVLNLLSATERVHRAHPDLPLITMSMGQLGLVSRLSGEVFGSCLTFGTAGQASAPGQAPVEDLRRV
ncbi:MAG: type I 3-dehydroquinate dehydratase, partial [Oscillospiraceae bacterium]|nr:type I 3-dehydroquinate dehydratase [Oscillospiraceae bacterium]